MKVRKLDFNWYESESTRDEFLLRMNINNAIRKIRELLDQNGYGPASWYKSENLEFYYAYDERENILYVSAYTDVGSEGFKRYYNIVVTGGSNAIPYLTSNIIGVEYEVTPLGVKEQYREHLKYMLSRI